MFTFYILSAKTINPNTKFGGASNKVKKTYRCEALKYFRVEVTFEMECQRGASHVSDSLGVVL